VPKRKRINEFFAYGAEARATQPRRDEGRECPGKDQVELAAKIAAERVFALLSGRIIETLEKCVARLEELEKRVARLEAGLARQPRGGSQRDAGRRRGKIADKLEEFLDRNRYLLLSEARQRLGVPPARAREAAEELGATEIELEGDVAILLPDHLEELDALLREARSPDPLEAAQKLGPYSRLFEKMRRSGIVYFDAARGHWRRLQ